MTPKYSFVFSILFLCLLALSFTYPAEKLLAPAKLVEIIKSPTAPKPVILNVGPSAQIKGSTYIGNAEDPTNKERLKATVKNFPKNKDFVIYCGCCKLNDCGNVAEANKVLTSMGFTNFKILNMPDDFTVDWLNKGYPTE